MHRLDRLALAALVLSLAACASTQVTSVRDPAYLGMKYQRVVVDAPFTEMDKRAVAEKAFALQLQQHGVQAVGGMSVMPPTRTYTSEEIHAALQRAGADAVLQVTLTDSYTESVYVPPSSSSQTTKTKDGDTTTWTTTTRQDPGYYVNNPRVAFEMRLVDFASGGTAWLGTSLTKGDQFSGWDTLMNSLAAEAVARMAADGVVR